MTKWLGRACGAAAAVMLGLWLFWPSLGYLIAASPDGRWGLIACAGWLEIQRSPQPSFVVLLTSKSPISILIDYEPIFAAKQNRKAPAPYSIGHIALTPSLESGNIWRVRPEGHRWHPKLTRHSSTHGVSIPTWCLAAVPATVFAVAELRHRRCTRLERTGRCTHCNYNLAGIATNAPCPECGKNVGAKAI
ncbi:MAG: hypothetical protein QM783_17310 [Phycisphaerales bacterium]